MSNPGEKAVETVVEKAAEHLIEQLRGRTPDDTHYACTTVKVPESDQKVRVCVEPGWRSEKQEDPTTGAPVTVHVSPEYNRKQVREAVQHQLEEQRQRQIPAPHE